MKFLNALFFSAISASLGSFIGAGIGALATVVLTIPFIAGVALVRTLLGLSPPIENPEHLLQIIIGFSGLISGVISYVCIFIAAMAKGHPRTETKIKGYEKISRI